MNMLLSFYADAVSALAKWIIGRGGRRSVVEAMAEATAVDVECGENVEYIGDGKVAIDRPKNDVQVFLAGFQAVQNVIQKKRLALKSQLQETEVATVQFDPVSLALQMLEPAGTEVTRPVLPHPLAE